MTCALASGCSDLADKAQLDRIENQLAVIAAEQSELRQAIEDQDAKIEEVKDLADGIDTTVENIDCHTK